MRLLSVLLETAFGVVAALFFSEGKWLMKTMEHLFSAPSLILPSGSTKVAVIIVCLTLLSCICENYFDFFNDT
jgi:predicted outer membrane lipoprotein